MKFWNLAEDLQSTPARQATVYFAPPIAAAIDPASPFELAQDLPAPEVFSIDETYVDDVSNADPAKHKTTEVTFSISTPKESGTVDPRFPDLPAGVFRLHALTWGKITFLPATSTLRLEMSLFALRSSSSSTAFSTEIGAPANAEAFGAPWWQRWTDAGRIPKELLYDNVDVDVLRNLLNSIPALDRSFHGIIFPRNSDGTLIADRIDYVDKFLLGTDGYFFAVQAGAVLGAAGPLTSGPGNRQVRLRARYSDTEPMSPRELLYLAFGEKSTFSTKHPLFQRMNQLTDERRRTNGNLVSTNGMVMRPPLRTWRRVIWEAEQEFLKDEALRQKKPPEPHWGSDGYDTPTKTALSCKLGKDSLLDKQFRRNTSLGNSARLSYGDLDGENKCNVFVSDLCVRAGFKAFVVEIAAPAGHTWHYPDAATYCHLAREAIANSANLQEVAVQIKGTNASGDVANWGLARTRMLTSVPDTDAQRKTEAVNGLNRLMAEEGRVIILAGSRRRKRLNPNVATCTKGNFAARSGHIVFLESITGFKVPKNNDPANPGLPADGQTLAVIECTVSMSQSTSDKNAFTQPGGAQVHFDYPCELHGQAAVASGGKDFIRLHLFEPEPGGDPDLLQGLQTLHLRQAFRSHLNTVLDRAPKATITGSNQCCIDGISGNPSKGNCN